MTGFSRSLLPMLLVLCSPWQSLLAEELPADGKLVAGKAYGSFQIEAIVDLNDIVLTNGKQSLHFALANIVPFADWPKNAAYEKVGSDFLWLIQEGLVGKEALIRVLEVDEKGQGHGDLVIGPARGFGKEFWEHRLPSGKDGWGMTNVNMLLIERGYSPYVRKVYPTDRQERSYQEFDEAALIARHGQAGIFAARFAQSSKDNPFKEFRAYEVEQIARERSDESLLILRGLTGPQQMMAAKHLMELPDAKLRMAVVKAMHHAHTQGRSFNTEQRKEWRDVLLTRYFYEPELTIRRQMLSSLSDLNVPTETALPFLSKVLETEQDEHLIKIVAAWQKGLK